MKITELMLIDLFEDISRDELIKNLQKKRESRYLDMVLKKMHELVQSYGNRQSVGGAAFDISRMLGGAITGRELERLYKEKYTNESQINYQNTIFEDKNIIDNRKGWGAVPNNQEVDYLGLRVSMSPRHFIELATPLDSDPSKKITQHIKQGGTIGSPFLIIEIPEAWESGDFAMPARVVGHEGRNRMLAVEKVLGNNPIETHLFFSQGLRNRHITEAFKKNLNRGLIKEKSKSIVQGPFFNLQESILEWGRVVKGVNTTADVGTDEIKKQAAKFGNTVDKDGKPPTHNKKVKGSKTNVLHNLGLAENYTPMEIACIEGGHSLDDLKPLKEKTKTPGKIFETLIGLTEDIAPHGSPEQEAQLMIAGKKPAALTYEQDFFKHFQTPAEMYDWVVLKFDPPNSVYPKYVIAQPGEDNRAKQIASLVTAANKINFEFQNKNQEIKYHKTLGNLLGYKDSDIDDFIKSTVIKEAFDTDVEWIKGAAPQGASVFATKVEDAYIELTYKRMTNDDVYIAFSRRGRSNVTGEGKQNKIFGAVINHIKQWVNKNKPSKIIFSAWKPITGAFGAQDTTRSNLYRKMVQRFASQNGYDYDIEDTGNEDTFILKRKEIEEKLRSKSYKKSVKALSNSGKRNSKKNLKTKFGETSNRLQFLEEILLSEAMKDYINFGTFKFQEPNPQHKVDGVILGSKHYKDRETQRYLANEREEIIRMLKKFVGDPVSRKVTNVDVEEGVSFCLFNDNNLGVALIKKEFLYDKINDFFTGYLVTTISQSLLPYSDQLLFRVPNDPNEPCRLFNEQDKETLSRSQSKALGKQGRFGK